MPINPDLIGTSMSGSRPYEVSAEKIREFALAVGEQPGPVAPPTFPTVIDLAVAGPSFLRQEGSGIDLAYVVHGEQRYVYERPIRAGDVVSVESTFADLTARNGNEYLTIVSTFRNGDELICTGYNTIVSRGTASEKDNDV